jgi:hypothetical protein
MDAICSYLNIKTKISSSSDYQLTGDKTERLANLCNQSCGTQYISGPAAKEYIDEGVFKSLGIKLTWFDYSGYKPYTQLWGAFCHDVSILDLLFNCGKDAFRYLNHNP